MAIRQQVISGLLSSALCILVLILAPGCGSEDSATASAPAIDSTDTRSHTLNSLIVNNDQLHRLQEAMNAVDFHLKLRDEGPYTFFAPSNRALDRDIPNLDDLIAERKDTLRVILEQHLVRGALTPHEPGDSLEMSNLQGSPLVLAVMPNEELRVNNQRIRLHQNGQNGILYMIDTVLRPAPPVEPERPPSRQSAEMPLPPESPAEPDTTDEQFGPGEPLPNLPPDN